MDIHKTSVPEATTTPVMLMRGIFGTIAFWPIVSVCATLWADSMGRGRVFPALWGLVASTAVLAVIVLVAALVRCNPIRWYMVGGGVSAILFSIAGVAAVVGEEPDAGAALIMAGTCAIFLALTLGSGTAVNLLVEKPALRTMTILSLLGQAYSTFCWVIAAHETRGARGGEAGFVVLLWPAGMIAFIPSIVLMMLRYARLSAKAYTLS